LSDGAGGIFFRFTKNNKSDFLHFFPEHLSAPRSLALSTLLLLERLLPSDELKTDITIGVHHFTQKATAFLHYQKVAATTTKVSDLFVIFWA